MKTSYFQGKDGFVWWNGVVEDRKDPLFLGRCRVRILGWHTEDKSTLPTEDLPWAQAILPITSASQTGVGESPVGPVEGTWVMGFFRDGELAQEPVMMGTMHGIPADHAKQNTGFNDPRLDTDDTIPYRILETGETVDGGGEFDLEGFPYEPYKIELKPGEEATITNYTNEQRQEEKGKSLYPRWTNKPTTSVYARGMSDSSSNVQIDSVVSYKKKLLGSSKATIKSKFTASQTLINNSAKIKTPAAPYNAFINPTAYEVDETEKIDFPDTAYNAIYPFNHVYESESGHLIEVDDTPEAERLHWYHRAGTFTEFTFGGSRVENTQGHNFHSITGNLEEIISGKEKRSISNDSFSTYSKNKFQDIGNDYVLTTKGDLLLGSNSGYASLKGTNVVIDASQTLYMEATNIIRSQKSSRDVFRGSYNQEIFGGLNSKAETFSLNASIGSGQIITAGNMTHGIGGVSEETMSNPLFALNPNSKTIRALLGKIVLETIDPVSGGIDLSVGPFGVAGKVSIGKLGIIDITSKLGINISAIKETTLEGMVKAAVKGVLIDIIAQGIVKIEGAAIQLNGTSEPALKGKAFLDVFEKHQHTSSVGPTGGILPAYGMKAMKTMSQKVFLG